MESFETGQINGVTRYIKKVAYSYENPYHVVESGKSDYFQQPRRRHPPI